MKIDRTKRPRRKIWTVTISTVIVTSCCGAGFDRQFTTASAAEGEPAELPARRVTCTSNQVMFGVLGEKPEAPGPIVILIARRLDEMRQSSYSAIGRRLAKHGYLTIERADELAAAWLLRTVLTP